MYLDSCYKRVVTLAVQVTSRATLLLKHASFAQPTAKPVVSQEISARVATMGSILQE
jgi:hypothetical protein